MQIIILYKVRPVIPCFNTLKLFLCPQGSLLLLWDLSSLGLSKMCLTLSGPAFSVVSQARRGGSEAQMPKIKVNVNQLKWNLAWLIMAIKAFLTQNLSLVAFPVLEIWRHKISLGRRERVIKFGYLPPENGFNFKKWVFMSRIVLLDPKLTTHVNFSNFQVEENFFIL